MLARFIPHFICGFCYYFPLVLFLVLPPLLMFGVIGSKFGTHLLFFHDEPVMQAVVGISVGFYWVHVLFVGYLFCLRDLREGRRPEWGQRSAVPSFLEYLANILLHIALTVAFFVF